MSNFKNYRQQSRDIQWGCNTDEGLTIEQLNLGTLLRIADATEKMAEKYVQMEKDLVFYKGAYQRRGEQNQSLARRISALKGVITKLKKVKA